MKRLEEIRARFEDEMHRWGDVAILVAKLEDGKGIRIKLSCEEGELVVGLWYRFFGRWMTHERFGPQFIAQTYVITAPADPRGITAYLRLAPGVGRAVAEKLVKTFGQEAVRVLREEPERAASELGVKSFGLERATEAAAFLESQRGLEECTIDLLTLLAGRGLPRTAQRDAVQRWGNRAAMFIRRNPYLLMQLSGCGFRRADELYLELGHPPARLKRQAALCWAACTKARTGDTWFAATEIKAALETEMGSQARFRRAVQLAVRSGMLALRRDRGGAPWLAPSPAAAAEGAIACAAGQMMMYGRPAWPDVAKLDVSEHQRAELRRALGARLGVFAGGPGTGKTYTAARLIAALLPVAPPDGVAVVAPTGKAAVRITEALAGYGVPLRARTVHSFLGVCGTAGGFRFRHGPDDPVPPLYVICDEASMLSTSLLACLLEALRPDAHLLLVGDTHQLPPVEHGAPLRDLSLAGVPRGELTEIRRNSGAIVETCAAIREERAWSIDTGLDLAAGRNLARYVSSTDDAAKAIEALIDRVRRGGSHDPVWDVQVLCAVNERSAASRKELNHLLQGLLNAANRPRDLNERYWPRDKIVCLQNSFFPAPKQLVEDEIAGDEEIVSRDGKSGTEIYVANGELGEIVRVEPRRLIAEFKSPTRVVVIPRGGEDGGTEKIDLGYALSVHKAQGSEWPIVFVVLDDSAGARMVCDRSWLYTAISRARKICVLIGMEGTARDMCRRMKIDRRKTFLVERVEESLDEIRKLHAAETDRRGGVVLGGEGMEKRGGEGSEAEDAGTAAVRGGCGRQGEEAVSVRRGTR